MTGVAPAEDTLRGGAEIVGFAQPPVGTLDTSQDRSLRERVLPLAWSGATSGLASLTPTARGLIFATGSVGGATAVLSSDVSIPFEHFDMAVDVQLLNPVTSPNGPVEFEIEYRLTEGVWIKTQLEMGGLDDPAAVVVKSEYRQAGRRVKGSSLRVTTPAVTPGRTRPAPFPTITMRMVRHGARIYVLTGERDRDGFYADLTQLLTWDRWDLGGGGRFYLSVKNVGTEENLQVRATNLTFRSHMRIGDRLLVNKRDRADNRIVGDVPAAEITDLGETDIALFGLFGEAVGADAFTYTLPVPKTVGDNSALQTRTYQDVQLRDGEE